MSDIYGVPDPQAVVLRPLNKGMITNIPSQTIPMGGGLLVDGFDVLSSGLRTVSQWRPLIDNAASLYGRVPMEFVADGEYILDIIPFITIGGGKNVLALSTRALYVSLDLTSWTRVSFGRSYTVSSVLGNDITLSVDAETLDRVRPGMVITQGALSQEITAINGDTVSVADATGFAGGAALIYQDFGALAPFIVQWCRSPGRIYFVDSTARGVLYYDGNFLQEFFPHVGDGVTRAFSGATSIAYIGGRIVVGGTHEAGGEQRVRWSSVLDNTSFNPLDFADLTQTNGIVQRVTHFEDTPIVFVDDGVYFGQPYGYDAILVAAWIFRQLETGGASIVGPRAYTRVIGGIAFAGKDEFYYINSLKRTEKGDYAVEPMRCPILRETLRAVQTSLTQTQMIYDTSHKRLVIGLATSAAPGIDYFAAYHQESNAWSLFENPLGKITSLQDISATVSETWDAYDEAIPANAWSQFMSTSWYSKLSGFGMSNFTAVTALGHPYVMLRGLGSSKVIDDTNTETYAEHRATFITPDIDFDMPDDHKVAFKLALRTGSTEYTRIEPFRAVIRGSVDKGRTWKVLGNVTLAPDEDEEELHFRLFGTNLRFEISLYLGTGDTIQPVELEEITLRVRPSSQQVARSGTSNS